MEKYNLSLTLEGDFCETIVVDEKQKELLEYLLSQDYFYNGTRMTFDSVNKGYKDFT